eukprot:SAG31_NODE_185_length_20953_cov_17.235398_8_plen_102_part_00
MCVFQLLKMCSQTSVLGHVQSLKLKNGKDYTLQTRQSEGRAMNVSIDAGTADTVAGAQSDDMTSKILDVLGNIFVLPLILCAKLVGLPRWCHHDDLWWISP